MDGESKPLAHLRADCEQKPAIEELPIGEPLKPCPFCGGEAGMEDTEDGWLVYCRTKNCPVGVGYDPEEEARRVWNHRASDARIAELEAELERLRQSKHERYRINIDWPKDRSYFALCEGKHDKGAPCEWHEFVPKAELERERARVEQEREQCCRDVCVWCRSGMPERSREWDGMWTHNSIPCAAAAIRERHYQQLAERKEGGKDES